MSARHQLRAVALGVLRCSCGESFAKKTGEVDFDRGRLHCQLGPYLDGVVWRRQRLAHIPDTGCGTAYLAACWGISDAAARKWLWRAHFGGSVVGAKQARRLWWRRYESQEAQA